LTQELILPKKAKGRETSLTGASAEILVESPKIVCIDDQAAARDYSRVVRSSRTNGLPTGAHSNWNNFILFAHRLHVCLRGGRGFATIVV
jgi:hypothetical protein